jgi:hypothetical protein
MITDLVARSHLPTSDDLEFIGMVTGGDLIFDALCTDSDLDLCPLESSEEEPSDDKENKVAWLLHPIGNVRKVGRYMW